LIDYIINAINITLVDGGQIVNETRSLVYKAFVIDGLNWTLAGNATVLIKYLGGNYILRNSSFFSVGKGENDRMKIFFNCVI
jgi:hypothetical protein